MRCVEAGGKVRFYPVDIIKSTSAGMWVAGLPEKVELIVVGQEFVRQGDRVRVSDKDVRDGGNNNVQGGKTGGAPAS